MRKVLTDGLLRGVVPPASGRTELADLRSAGLAFRVTASGARSWCFRFRDPMTGKASRATIGTYPAIGLSAARSSADAMRRAVAAGKNPADEKRASRAGGSSKLFGALAERYLKEYSRRFKRSHAADERNLRLHVLPKWKHRAYATITRADVIELVEGLVAGGKETLANRVHSLISGVFTFALDADLLQHHPCYRLRKRGKESVGNRVLSDDEIRLFWPGILEPEATKRSGLALRLVLLTGARVTEVAGIARAELAHIDDPARSEWTIPGVRTKNKRDHLVPLSALARETILELLALIDRGEKFLLPTRSTKRRGPIRGNTLTQAMDFFARRLVAAPTGLRDAMMTWKADAPTPHDLRRTVETRLASLKFPKETRDRVLNHVSAGTGDKHYNRYDYADEKRTALNAWAAALARIVDGRGGVVVPLRIGGGL